MNLHEYCAMELTHTHTSLSFNARRWVKVSYDKKQYLRTFMQRFGADVHASLLLLTTAGKKKTLGQHPHAQEAEAIVPVSDFRFCAIHRTGPTQRRGSLQSNRVSVLAHVCLHHWRTPKYTAPMQSMHGGGDNSGRGRCVMKPVRAGR